MTQHLYGQEPDTRTLNLVDYDDCERELSRIRKEAAEVMDHLYMYESVEDTEVNDTTEYIAQVMTKLDDALEQAWRITQS